MDSRVSLPLSTTSPGISLCLHATTIEEETGAGSATNVTGTGTVLDTEGVVEVVRGARLEGETETDVSLVRQRLKPVYC